MFNKLISLSITVLVVSVGVTVAQMPITSIKEVRDLTPEVASERHSVQIEGQVMLVNPAGNHFFLFDGEFGVFVGGISNEPSVVEGLAAGDMVQVWGKTSAGSFMPHIDASRILVRDNKPRPDPQRFYDTDYTSTWSDCKWGQVWGRLLSMRITPDKRSIFIEMSDVSGRDCNVHLPYSEYNENRVRELMFSFVEFGAVCGTIANENRQMVARIFYVHSADDFVISGEQWDLNKTASAEIHELLRYGITLNRPYKTKGVVIHAGDRVLYLRGEIACIKVVLSEPVSVALGETVSVRGFVWPESVSPAFRGDEIEVIGRDGNAEPVPLDLSLPLDPLMNYNLVQLEAELVEMKKDYDEGSTVPHYILRCRSAGEFFEARLPSRVELDKKLGPGTVLELTGICHMQRMPEDQLNLIVSGFWLLLRDAADVHILKPAPWWTTARLLMMLGGVLVIALASIVWVVVLRRTVDRQTRVIADKVERESILDERQRIARELHDNLEQGLAGAIFQLGGVRRLFKKNSDKNQELLQGYLEGNDQQSLSRLAEEWPKDSNHNLATLEAVENMLSYCSVESRSSILDLRGGLLEKMNLVEAVGETLRRLGEDGGPELALQVEGNAKRYELPTERNILLMIKEATSNAIRHASATRIDIVLDYTDGLKATVSDDGCGFNIEEKKNSGRFGLKGMQERIQNINGSLMIESEVGKGTAITAELKSVEVAGRKV